MSTQTATFPTGASIIDRDAGSLGLDRLGASIHDLIWGAPAPSMGRVLLLWRAAERDLEAATPGSEAWNSASAQFLVARSEYQRMFSLAAVGAEGLRTV